MRTFTAVIAYLRSQPATANDTLLPPDQPNALALILTGVGMIPEGEPPITAAINMPTKGATAEFGAVHLELSGLRGMPRRESHRRRHRANSHPSGRAWP